MAEREHHDQGSNLQVAYERSDASAWGVVLFGVSLIVMGIIVYGAVWWLFGYWSARELAADKRPFGATYAPKNLPPAPQLEALRRQQPGLAATEEQTPPDSYGWVDPRRRIARIPVRRAAELLAGKLPAEDFGKAERPKQDLFRVKQRVDAESKP